jgi:hypothetical protein
LAAGHAGCGGGGFDGQVLVTKDGSEQQPEEIGWDFHSNPLQPFTNELWGAIFAAFVLTSVAYSLVRALPRLQARRILVLAV